MKEPWRLPAFPHEPQDIPTAPTTQPYYHTVRLEADALAIGQPLHTLDVAAGVLLVTIERVSQTRIPHGETVLAAGDRVTLFAEPHQIQGTLATLVGIATADSTPSTGEVYIFSTPLPTSYSCLKRHLQIKVILGLSVPSAR